MIPKVKVQTEEVSGLIGIVHLPTLDEFIKLLNRVNQLEQKLAELDTRTIDRIRIALENRDSLNI